MIRGSFNAGLRSYPGLVPGVVEGVVLPDDPSAIFGADLKAWWDIRDGVATASGTGVPRITSWTDKVGGHVASGADTTSRPKLITDTDGTPSAEFEASPNQTLALGTSPKFGTQHTVYALAIQANTAAEKCLLVGAPTNTLHYLHGNRTSPVKFPGTYRDGAHWAPLQSDVLAWAVTRFGGDSVTDKSLIAVDDRAEYTDAQVWSTVTNSEWTGISHSYAGGQALVGNLKHILVVDRYVKNADAEHVAVLAWFKSVYPTLVSY